MITKSLIAAAAVAASLTALAPVQQAQAKIIVNVGAGFDFGGGFYPGYGYGYGEYHPIYQPYYGGKSCWQVKHKLKMMNFKKVHPFDCSAPTYRFKVKKFGIHHTVKTDVWGNILAVY